LKTKNVKEWENRRLALRLHHENSFLRAFVFPIPRRNGAVQYNAALLWSLNNAVPPRI
jgi:hypothetical protein